ncbi:MAG: putative DNA-binding protein [Clostridia bacterium]|nr:putative DNA-binding protein [Clostridia bacterium]MDR3644237.1 putative DNA-binding protein [Clostridia bacterium]
MKEKNYEVSLLLDFYGQVLTEKQREVIELYYDEDLSLAEIAEHTGITRQGVRDCIKRGEAVLFEMEQKLGLSARFAHMKGSLQEIIRSAKEIGDYNERYCCSQKIAGCTRSIVETAEKLCEDDA